MLALSSGGRWALELFYVRGSHLHFAVGAAALMAVLFSFATSRSPTVPSPAFADRWNAVPTRDVLLSKPVRTLPFVVPTVASNPALPEIDGFLQVPMPPVKQQEKVVAVITPERPPPPRLAASAKADHRETKGPDICRGKGRIITQRRQVMAVPTIEETQMLWDSVAEKNALIQRLQAELKKWQAVASQGIATEHELRIEIERLKKIQAQRA